MLLPPNDYSVGVNKKDRKGSMPSDGEVRMRRALTTLGAGNHTLLHATTERELLNEMCRIIVEEGGYPMAWVGYAEHDEKRSIRVMAHAGEGGALVTTLPTTWAESGIGLGPTGAAIRTGAPVVGRNLHADPNLAQARAQLVDQGFPDYASASVFPLCIDGEVIGNLSIYAEEPDAFDEAEAKLLRELADDLAFGIATHRLRVKREEAEQTIERMAFFDNITGLPNRMRLREQLDGEIITTCQRGVSLALLVLKVEHFQEITDSLGYREGDHLLAEIGTRLSDLVGGRDMLARGGEDEFVVLLPGADAKTAETTAQSLIAGLHESIELSGLRVNARISIGIALCPAHGRDSDSLLRRAGVAAVEARRTASGYAFYIGSLDQDHTRRLALMGELRLAIERNELQLYCQPKVCIASRKVCGAEALVRWPHPRLGLVATGEFVRLAEHAGLISPLTHWVLDAAFGQAHAWRDGGFEQPLAVNLSAHDLRDPLLFEHIKGLFAKWGIPPEAIAFELTESALMDDPAGARKTLVDLKELGVTLYIDDFGTGYSSLSYLRHLPVDSIKIDRSFVASMIASHDSAIIVRSTIELGHNLDLKVVAEGVENVHIWDSLTQLGCDVAQGYYVSAPIHASTFRQWSAESVWHGGAADGRRT